MTRLSITIDTMITAATSNAARVVASWRNALMGDVSACVTDPFYDPSNIARLKKSIEQMEKYGGTVHEVSGDD